LFRVSADEQELHDTMDAISAGTRVPYQFVVNGANPSSGQPFDASACKDYHLLGALLKKFFSSLSRALIPQEVESVIIPQRSMCTCCRSLYSVGLLNAFVF